MWLTVPTPHLLTFLSLPLFLTSLYLFMYTISKTKDYKPRRMENMSTLILEKTVRTPPYHGTLIKTGYSTLVFTSHRSRELTVDLWRSQRKGEEVTNTSLQGCFESKDSRTLWCLPTFSLWRRLSGLLYPFFIWKERNTMTFRPQQTMTPYWSDNIVYIMYYYYRIFSKYT